MTGKEAIYFLLFLCLLLQTSLIVADEPSTEQKVAKKVAIATLVTTSSYVAGAEVLAESLANVGALGDRILFYVLPEDDTRSDITEEHLKDLRDAGWQTRRLSKEDGTFSECLVPEAQRDLIEKEAPTIKRYWGTCSKFAIWTLTEFDAVIYLDADSVVVNNFDFVFDLVLKEEKEIAFFAQGSPGCWDDPPDCNTFYTAFLAIRPADEIQKYLAKVSQMYSAPEGELMLLNNVFKELWSPLPRYTMVAQTERLRPPTDPPSIRVDWSQVKVYDFSGLPVTKPWHTYALQKETGDKYVHGYLGRIPEHTTDVHIYMYPQWIWNDLYDAVLERKRRRREVKEPVCDDVRSVSE